MTEVPPAQPNVLVRLWRSRKAVAAGIAWVAGALGAFILGALGVLSGVIKPETSQALQWLGGALVALAGYLGKSVVDGITREDEAAKTFALPPGLTEEQRAQILAIVSPSLLLPPDQGRPVQPHQ